jgi:DNA invertase Pin-like site-specific DNA recombinase
VQRERIEAWARAYDHELVALYEELDESGARADRPKLLEAIGRIESRQCDGLIVHKADRFGRGLIDGLQQIERIAWCRGTLRAESALSSVPR